MNTLFSGQSLVWSAVAAACAFFVAALRINHGLVGSSLAAGPGLTLDESFNIQQGVYLVEALRQHGPLIMTPAIARDVFSEPRYLPDHPPLGRLLLGLAHENTSWLISGAELSRWNVPAARLGACGALGLLVFLLSEFARHRFGLSTAMLSSLFLILMPQFTGHARLATLEMATALAWLAALIPLLSWWTGPQPPTTRQAAVSGLLWGLLMLTKMQGVLLPPLAVSWAVWRFGRYSLRPLLVWGLAGGLVFAAWPWLWQDPLQHTLQYLGRATERQTLYVWYFGQRFADRHVPWHYPFVLTLITVPLFVLPGLAARLLQRRMQAAEILLLASLLWPLLVFAVPGTPVYDGSRLFLCVMPAVAVLAARGCLLLCEHSRSRPLPGRHRAARWLARVALLVTALALGNDLYHHRVMSPYAIDTYSDLIGGTAGAAQWGMESSYWSDGLNGPFWESVPENSTVLVAPVLHQFQLRDLETLVPVVRQRNLRLVPFEYDPQQQRGLMLLLHRLADLRQSMQTIPPGADLIHEVRHEGVVLARLIDTTRATWSSTP